MRVAENMIAQVEQGMNPIDWIPYISGVSGIVRATIGLVEVVAGLAFAALKTFHIILTGKGFYSDAISQGLTYSMHGLGNILRGEIAMTPFWNLALFVYDKYVGRMDYEEEMLKKGVYPLMTAHRRA